MPDLAQSLRDRDFGYLKIVADFWAIALEGAGARQAAPALARRILDREQIAETLEVLPPEARQVLDDVVAAGGRIPWALFTRRFGIVREMGPGKRDRERPYLSPISPAEVLWYRALIARAFFDGDAGPEEFAYIPDDLLALLAPAETAPARQAGQTLGRPALSEEAALVQPAVDHILDHACTLLAARRLGLASGSFSAGWTIPENVLAALLRAAQMISAEGPPEPEMTKRFLEAGRGEALARLVTAWLDSETFDDLAFVGHLEKEGEWHNDPLKARRAVWDELQAVPIGGWWQIDSFIEAFKNRRPDFQRPAGDYDSWYLRDRRTGVYLRGFEHWDDVDGALIRFLICGPLHWLGLFDLAHSTQGGAPAAFRWSRWAAGLRERRPAAGLAEETSSLLVRSDGRLVLPRLVARGVRYQVARFCAWEEMWPATEEENYQFQLTPRSLDLARQQGLRLNHLLALLRRHAERVPPNIGEALARWEEFGVEARLEQATILRLRTPEMLQELRNSRAARFLGVPLGPTSVIVKPGARRQVMAALAELGIMVDFSGEA